MWEDFLKPDLVHNAKLGDEMIGSLRNLTGAPTALLPTLLSDTSRPYFAVPRFRVIWSYTAADCFASSESYDISKSMLIPKEFDIPFS